MSLKGKKIIVGLTGGIACYKVPYLIRDLDRGKAEVQVIMTEAATEFITPLTMETVSKRSVAINMFPRDQYVATRHIELATWADLFVIAPATANFIAKAANGICDDLLTTIICATPKPIFLAPAMNPGMWNNPSTQENFAKLTARGYKAVGPEKGEMAEPGHSGVGRMSEPDKIFKIVSDFFSKKKALNGKHILVTAGPTREELDPVRYLTNYSSGRMGYAIAEAAVEMGAQVTLISGPVDIAPPAGVNLISVTSTEQLRKAVLDKIKKFDCLIMAAAPADYTPKKRNNSKIKRSKAALSLDMISTPDILKDVSDVKKKGQVIVGFALETDNAVDNAVDKLKRKKLDLIVLNKPSKNTGFGTETNQLTIITPDGKKQELPLANKSALAYKLLEIVLPLL